MEETWDNTVVFRTLGSDERHCGAVALYAFQAYCGVKVLHKGAVLSAKSSTCPACRLLAKKEGKLLK